MEYNVSVRENASSINKNYIVDVALSNKQHNSCSQRTMEETQPIIDNSDPSMVINIAQIEYDHCVKRMDRLDNKIYILLTVCAFIFVMITSAISNIKNLKIPQSLIESIVLVLYFIFVIFVICEAISLLKGLIDALSSIKLTRFDSANILDYDMVTADKHQVSKYVIGIYENARQHNNDIIDAKYTNIDKCVKKLIRVIILLILLTVISNFIPVAEDQCDSLAQIVLFIEKQLR